jgi:tetratricopeptide (TPR) repeat protein
MTNSVLNLVLLALIFPLQAPVVDGPLKEADELYTRRDDLEKLRQAAAIAEKQIAGNRTDYEALWRLAKFRYYLADRETDKDKRVKIYQSGADTAKRAIAANPNRVEGHFWMGANTGELASLKGALDSLGLIRSIRREFEAALAIDPTYGKGTIHLALGEMDLRLPRLFGGNERRGLQRLESGLQFGEHNAELKLALAEVYIKKNRADQARTLLDGILANADPLRTPVEMDGLRSKAKAMLDKIK